MSSRSTQSQSSGTSSSSGSGTKREKFKYFKFQHYAEIYASVKEGKLFEDMKFQPAETSIYVTEQTLPPGTKSLIEWKRPKELHSEARLFTEEIRLDIVDPGQLSDFWFVTLCYMLSNHKDIFSWVIPNPTGQNFGTGGLGSSKYRGIFKFHFWTFGETTEVVIDDFLPTLRGALLYCRNQRSNEFWGALLEKAFAKFYGCYERLLTGTFLEGFMFASGGVPEQITLLSKDNPQKLFDTLNRCLDEGYPVAAITNGTGEKYKPGEQDSSTGLVVGHVYPVVAVTHVSKLKPGRGPGSADNEDGEEPSPPALEAKVEPSWLERMWLICCCCWRCCPGKNRIEAGEEKAAKGKKTPVSPKADADIPLIELKDLWNKASWNGPFSPKMSWDAFCKCFSEVNIVHLFDKPSRLGLKYEEQRMFGEWRNESGSRLNNRAGGCTNYKETWFQNPQYCFDCKDHKNGTVAISLIQEGVRHKKNQTYKAIGITVLKVEENRTCRLHSMLEECGSSEFIDREFSFLRLSDLSEGRYIVIPSTFDPGQEGKFYLRMFSLGCSNFKDLKTDAPKPPPNASYSGVTRIKIHKVSVDSDVESQAGAQPFLVVKCDDETWKSTRSKDGFDFEKTVLIYRRNISAPVHIEVWNWQDERTILVGSGKFEVKEQNEMLRYDIPLTKGQSTARVVIDCGTFTDVTCI